MEKIETGRPKINYSKLREVRRTTTLAQRFGLSPQKTEGTIGDFVDFTLDKEVYSSPLEFWNDRRKDFDAFHKACALYCLNPLVSLPIYYTFKITMSPFTLLELPLSYSRMEYSPEKLGWVFKEKDYCG